MRFDNLAALELLRPLPRLEILTVTLGGVHWLVNAMKRDYIGPSLKRLTLKGVLIFHNRSDGNHDLSRNFSTLDEFMSANWERFESLKDSLVTRGEADINARFVRMQAPKLTAWGYIRWVGK